MAGIQLVSGAGSSLAVEALYKGGRGGKDPLLSAFEKEINFILKPLRKKSKILNHEICQKLSNSLFSLWNKYQHRLSLEFLSTQLLKAADLFYEAGLYHLARTQGYRRCLERVGLLKGSEGEDKGIFEDYVSSCGNKAVTVNIFQCEIGDSMCLYLLALEKDPTLMENITRTTAMSTLNRLRSLSRVALLREDRYWLAHNAFAHILSICCKMMQNGCEARTVEYLLWCAVCMESSVPLMAPKYLPLRTNFYVTATHCYYSIGMPHQAELFARRALDKVSELSDLMKQSSSSPGATPGTGTIFKECTVKLSVMIFKHSIFEVHKKAKQPYKYRFRVNVRDLLQLPYPRSSTEKMLAEMFVHNSSAQYVAILETLSDYSRRALDRGPPPNLGDSDFENQNEVYIELFAAGVEISLKTFASWAPALPTSMGTPLMEAAVQNNSNTVPIESMAKFVRLAYIYEQSDVMRIVGARVIDAALVERRRIEGTAQKIEDYGRKREVMIQRKEYMKLAEEDMKLKVECIDLEEDAELKEEYMKLKEDMRQLKEDDKQLKDDGMRLAMMLKKEGMVLAEEDMMLKKEDLVLKLEDMKLSEQDKMLIGMGEALNIMIAMNKLSTAHKKCTSSNSHGGGGGGGNKRGTTSAGTAGKRVGSATSYGDAFSRKSSATVISVDDTGRISAGLGGRAARLSPLLGASRQLRKLSAMRMSPLRGLKVDGSTKGSSRSLSPQARGKGKAKSPRAAKGDNKPGVKDLMKDEVRQTSGGSGGVEDTAEEHHNPVQTADLHTTLNEVICFLHFTLKTTPYLLKVDYDLLLDSLVMCWEILRPALSSITTQDYLGCKAFLTHTMGIMCAQLLSKLVAVAHWLELWRHDALLHGELCLKHCCILEAGAESRDPPGTVDNIPVTFMAHDRAKLLECRRNLEQTETFIKQAREQAMRVEGGRRPGETVVTFSEDDDQIADLAIVHAECVYALTRVQVKLAAASPPPDYLKEDDKASSSLKSRVREREERKKQKLHVLSQLTALDVEVPTLEQLRQACGRSHYRQALLLMLQATNTPGLDTAQKNKLLEESCNQLSLEQQWLENSQAPATTTTKSPVPPPPLFMWATETSMEFSVPPFTPHSKDTPTGTNEPPRVAYYKLFGRLAAGSNVKVREMDKLFPGLGIEVPADDDCRLMVDGLQPHEDYVFAVAGYTQRGKLLGKAVGLTSKPFRTTFTLPLLTAWGYCCQCAFSIGSKSVAIKSSKVLWSHFVREESRQTASKSGRYHLKLSTIYPASATHLHLFITSILISTQLGFTQSSLKVDQLSTSQGQLLPSQLQRVELVRKLLVGIEVAGYLNNAQLCLQMVVKCYGLLAPLLQHRISSRAVVEVLLHCQAVLAELPEHLLTNKSNLVTAALHHMIGAIGYYVGKLLLSWHNKPLFARFTESVRTLMVVTLSGAAANQSTPQGEITLAEATSTTPLEQSSFISSIQDTAISGFASVINSNVQPALDSGVKKKKGRKKVHILSDHIPDEQKTAELKAMEAFVVTNQQQIEDLDLTGGEDPVVLHYIIHTHPSIVAHREVLKFKRRPQFLEMFVHLLNLTLAKGHFDRVLEWASEGFQWLGRRNEILLNPRMTQKITGEQILASKGKLSDSSHLFSSLPTKADLKKFVQRAREASASIPGSSMVTVPVAAHSAPGRKHSRIIDTASVGSKTTKSSQDTTAIPRPGTRGRREAVVSAQQFNVRKSMLPNLAAELNSRLRITKDDLDTKTCYVLITQLTELWKLHKCRKRLRSVTTDEYPWRSQLNLTLASCYLNQALGRMRSGFSLELGEESGGDASSDGLRFDVAGVIIEGVVPILPSALAGQGNKPLTSIRSRVSTKERGDGGTTPSSVTLQAALSSSTPGHLITEDLKQVMTFFQRATVLAERGRLWTLLQNIARSLWNAINALLLAVSKQGREMRENQTALIYGLAMKPLYFMSEGLIELLEKCGCGGDDVIPQVLLLNCTTGVDENNGVGVAFIKQLVFLTLHVLYVHQHWEKVIALGMHFDDVTRHSWADQLVPVISSAQTNLIDRIATHSYSQPISSTNKLDPAAHLDPGPKGYDIYGPMGKSLQKAPSSFLDKQNVLRRTELLYIKAGGKYIRDSHDMLLECRRLFQRYTAGKREVATPADDEIMNEMQYKESPSVTCLTEQHVSVLVNAYSKTVEFLQADGNRDLTVQAMNELGDVMMLAGNLKMSRHWWLEGLGEVLGIKTPLTSWRQVLPITLKGCGGLWACLQGAMMATKLLRHVYWKHLDVRLECALLAATFLKTILTYSLPYPSSDMAYATLDHHTHPVLLPGVELFSDTFRCSPAHLLSALHWCSRELITRGYTKKVLPILWLYNHVALVDCRSMHDTVAAKILRLRVLTQLSLFSAAIQQLHELLNGIGLPQGSTHSTRPAESTSSLPKFQDHLPIADQANIKVILAVVEKTLKPPQEVLYGTLNASRLAVARAGLYIALAQSQSIISAPLHTSSFSLATGGSSRQSTSLSPCPSAIDSGSVTSLKDSVGLSRHESNFPNLLRPSSSRRTRPSVKLALLDRAERMLDMVNQLDSSRSAERVENRVRALLGLAQLAVSLHHCISGYQLSLQGLRLLQTMEDGGKEGIAVLKQTDLFLWIECRYWMTRSVVGLDSPPGGGSLLLEVGEYCEECGQHGEVEMVAEMECAAAEHALSLLPCQLEAAQQHSQRCVEMLSSLPELSHRGELLHSRATLILADTTSIHGTGGLLTSRGGEGGGMGEQMAGVYTQLIGTIKKQISEEQVPSIILNAYQPRSSLLASALLRLGHTLMLMASRKTGGGSEAEGSRREVMERAQQCFKEGLDVMQECGQFDPSLLAELLIGNGLTMAALPDLFKLEESIAMLFKGGKMLVDGGTDYRLASTVFLTLAELYGKKKARSLKRSDRRKSVSIVINADEPAKSTGCEEKEKEKGWEGKWDKGGWEYGGKEGYLAWCMVRSALKIANSRQTLLGFASSTNSADMTKQLGDKILHDLPDFVLLELEPRCETLDMLSNKPLVLPIERLLPSRQFRTKKGINWFKIINYYNRLVQRCYWQKVALHLPDSDWSLHYNFATPSVYTKTKAVFNFLNSHCNVFKSCLLPSIPQLSMLPGGSITPYTGNTGIHREPHLAASETEVTILWYSNPFSTLLAAGSLPTSQAISGYYAMNYRTVNFPIHNEPYILGIETHVIHTSVRALTDLYEKWEELAKIVTGFLDSRAIRPTSRSPSKVKKAEKSIMQPPEEVAAAIPVAVKEVAKFLKSTKSELPVVEPHAVGGLGKVIEPFVQVTLKGDALYFLRELWKPSH